MTTTTPARVVLRHVRELMTAAGVGPLPDAELIRRFHTQGDEAAFDALVRRHGPLVWGVCRRVLANFHDAEDAFQATFLTLAQKATAAGQKGSVAGWLYRVAYHAAVEARGRAARRRERERQVPTPAAADPLEEVTGRELLAVLDQELQRLPDRCRSALALCYLEGKTRAEAARQLGLSLGTLKRRLEEGRRRLGARLSRRGLSLSAGLLSLALAQAAKAAVPPQLATAAARAALGRSATPAFTLAGAAKLKITAAVLVAMSTLLLGAVALKQPAQGEPPAAAQAPQKEGSKPVLEQPARTLTVAGRVLDPDGKPRAGAAVAVTAWQGALLSSWQRWTHTSNEVLGRTTSDADGRFRLTVPRTDPQLPIRQVRIVAAAKDCGVVWKGLSLDAEREEAELRLTAVQPVRGRIVDLQGGPAASVTLHVVRLIRPPAPGEPWGKDAHVAVPEALPLGVTTDADGRFDFRGFGPGLRVEIEIRDVRYQRKDEWWIDTADPKQREGLRLALAPGQVAEGRVVCEDTGKPMPHARLMLASSTPYVLDAQADAEGRFRVSLLPGTTEVGVHAYPPEGEPYLPALQVLDFPRGVVRREYKLAVPRGVLVRGTVTEAGSGKPVAGAFVEFNADPNRRVRTRDDGSYRIAAPVGEGRLMVTHPNGEFISQIVGSAGGSLDKPVGDPSYYHAVVAVDVKAGDKEKEVPVRLRRGVTVKGRLVGPDGKPINGAVLFVGGHHRPRAQLTMHPVFVRDGAFEVRGLDPDRKYQFLFLEHPKMPELVLIPEGGPQSYGQLWLHELLGGKDKRGAAVEVSPKKAAEEPSVVHLAPCGSAKLRFVDAAGKPLADFTPWIQLVVTPGPAFHKALEDKALAAEVISLAGPGIHSPKTDAQGFVTYHGLIPGATYRVKNPLQGPQNVVLRDFTVESGKTAEIEVVVP
jgi:RNA polymerase sigma factor (sigma-70 family)